MNALHGRFLDVYVIVGRFFFFIKGKNKSLTSTQDEQ